MNRLSFVIGCGFSLVALYNADQGNFGFAVVALVVGFICSAGLAQYKREF